MNSIQPFGKFFPQTENGVILNDTSFEKIASHWLTVIKKIKSSYIEHLGEQVHSIYIRGSIPRGMQVDGFSDIDVFALLHDFEKRWEVADWQPELERELQKEFPFVQDVEIMLSQHFEDFYQKNQRLAMIIKTQSLCLYGKDLKESLPTFYPNLQMMLNLSWLESDLEEFLQKELITEKDYQEMIKVIIRSGFELVMEKEGKFTTDLYLCYQVFSKYFPNKAKEMRKMLQFYLNPSIDFPYLSKKIEVLGKWMIQQL